MVSWRDSGFAWLYGVLKRQWFCLCEICKNALFLVNGLDKKSISRKLTSSNHKWAGCEVLMRRCWKMHVREMRKVLFLHEDFNVESIADSDSENSNTSYSDCDYNQQTAIAAFYEWACEGTKLKQMLFKESIDIATRKFTSTMTTLKHHIYAKRVHFNQYGSIRSNLGRNDILDYSERCEDKQQHEIQKHLLRSYVIQYIYRKLLLSRFCR